MKTTQEHSFISADIHHHKSEITSLGITGYGTSTTKELSILKSISECVERYYFKTYFSKRGHTTSNGLACGSSASAAMESASLELIERHILISHWHSMIAPHWIEKSKYESILNSNELSLINIIHNLGYKIKFGILGLVNSKFICIAAIKKTNCTGYAIATSASSELFISLSKCLEDSLRVVDLIESRTHAELPFYKQIIEDDVKYPKDHLEFYLNPDNWKTHEWFFNSNPDIRSYAINNIRTEYIKDNLFTGLPLFIGSAKSIDIQNMYFGKMIPSILTGTNLLTLKNICLHPLA